MSFLKNFIKKIYHQLPLKFRHRFSTWLWGFFYLLKSSLNPIYPKVFIFKGLEKDSQLPIAFSYVGLSSQFPEYCVQAILAPGYQKHDLGRHLWYSIVPLLKKDPLDCSLLFVENNFLTLCYFSKDPGFNIPRWVDMEMDISRPIEELLGGERSKIQRKIEKYELTGEITRERKYFDNFYRDMYLSHIQSKYKNAAQLCSQPRVNEILSQGELMVIKKEGAVIAAGAFDFHKNEARFRLIGVKDGNREYVQYGCVGALYYFIVIEMKKRGYKIMQLGGTRPLLSDGVTKFKKSLKANAVFKESNICVRLRFLKDSPSLQNFLIKNPFIFYAKNRKLHRAVFMEAKENCSQQELKNALHVSDCNGIDKTNLFIFSNIQNPAHYAGLITDPSLVVQSAKELFSG